MEERRTEAMRGKTADAAATPGAAVDPPAETSSAAPSKGPTWIIQIAGCHYHNADTYHQGAEYLNETLIKNLREKTIELPSEDGKTEKVSMKDLGISYPTIVKKSPLEECVLVDPNAQAPDAGGMGNMMGNAGYGPMPGDSARTAETLKPLKFDFVVQFCWQPKTPAERRQGRQGEGSSGESQESGAGRGQDRSTIGGRKRPFYIVEKSPWINSRYSLSPPRSSSSGCAAV